MKKLTLSMIVKNEEKYLEGCLNSVKEIVDEIVIVDTGSTDKTLEIAKKFNARIYHFNWINDFSAARNFALSESNGEWILYLDADERLSGKSIEELKKIINLKGKIGVNCIVNNIDEYSGNNKKMNYVRLFKNSESIRFTGMAHEQILGSLIQNNYEIINSSVEIIHLGYNLPREELKQKAERNLSLLLEEYKKSKSSYYAYQIGNTYAVMEDDKSAYKYYGIALEDKNLENEYRAVCYLNMADYEKNNGNLNRAEELILEGIKEEPGNVWLHLLASQIYLALNNGKMSLRHCKTAWDIAKSNDGKNKALEIEISEKKVLYQAMLVSLKTQDGQHFEHFLIEFEKAGNEEETKIIKNLILNKKLEDNDISKLNEVIADENLELYLTMISKLDFKNRIEILFNLYERFENNTKFLVLVGFSLMEAKNYDEAEEVFLHSFTQKEKDPSVIFYLISIYLETGQIKKIPELLAFADENFRNNTLVISKLNDIKLKLQPIIEQYQPTS